MDNPNSDTRDFAERLKDSVLKSQEAYYDARKKFSLSAYLNSEEEKRKTRRATTQRSAWQQGIRRALAAPRRTDTIPAGLICLPSWSQ